MIKILNVLTDTNIGGAGRLLVNYLKNFDRNLFDIDVALPENSALIPEVEKLGYKVIKTEYGKDKSFEKKAVAELKKIIKEGKYDIVHSHSSLSAKIASFLCGTKSRLYTRHCAFEMPRKLCTFPGKQINGFINNTLSTRIIAVAEAAKDNLTETGVSEKKITVIVNGVEPMREITQEEKSALRKQLCIEENDFVCAINARLEDVKGHEYFIDAAKIVCETENDAKFLIIGKGSLEEQLKKKVEELGLSQKVIFTGFVNDVAPYINIMDLNINCSYGTETSSLALSEGMSLSKPAIATVFGGNPYMITEGENGFLVPIKDAPALAKEILRIKNDKELYNNLCRGANDNYHKKFTAKAMTDKLSKIYIQEYERITK